MRLARRLVLAAALLIALRVGLRSAATPTPPSAPPPPAARLELDEPALAGRLAEAVRFRTVSESLPGDDARREFAAFHAWLAQRFPRVHRHLSREHVEPWSLLYTWRGRRPTLPPVVLAAHQDVVPAENDGSWTHPPFAGVVADGFVHGRGALDDKSGLVGLLEACEWLLASGFAPERTILLAFGHDEEVSGENGAARIAALLGRRGVGPAWVLDEGGFLTDGIVPGVARPVALVATAEKGAAYVELSVRNPGPAHSSSPARDDPVAVLARALVRLDQRPWDTRLVAPARAFLQAIAPETRGLQRIALDHLWLFEPLVRRQLAAHPGTNALIRTTAVGTRLVGGAKDSAIPDIARATVSVRILPGDTVGGVVEHLTSTIDDPRVALRVMRAREPSPTSPHDSAAFDLLRRTVDETFPGTVVAPTLATGGTDARHYAGLTPHVLRFLPVRGTMEELRRVHGRDERVSVAAYADGVRFYIHLLENAGRS